MRRFVIFLIPDLYYVSTKVPSWLLHLRTYTRTIRRIKTCFYSSEKAQTQVSSRRVLVISFKPELGRMKLKTYKKHNEWDQIVQHELKVELDEYTAATFSQLIRTNYPRWHNFMPIPHHPPLLSPPPDKHNNSGAELWRGNRRGSWQAAWKSIGAGSFGLWSISLPKKKRFLIVCMCCCCFFWEPALTTALWTAAQILYCVIMHGEKAEQRLTDSFLWRCNCTPALFQRWACRGNSFSHERMDQWISGEGLGTSIFDFVQ